MSRNDQSEWVGTVGAAQILKSSEATARRLADEGHLRSQVLDTGKRIYARSDVEQLAAAREAARNSPSNG